MSSRRTERPLRLAFGSSLAVLLNLIALYAMPPLLGVPIAVASFTGASLGLLAGFIIHRNYTFRAQNGSAGRQVAPYLAVYLSQMALGAALLTLLVERLGLAVWLAFILATPLTAFWSYVGLSVFTFGPRNNA